MEKHFLGGGLKAFLPGYVQQFVQRERVDALGDFFQIEVDTFLRAYLGQVFGHLFDSTFVTELFDKIFLPIHAFGWNRGVELEGVPGDFDVLRVA